MDTPLERDWVQFAHKSFLKATLHSRRFLRCEKCGLGRMCRPEPHANRFAVMTRYYSNFLLAAVLACGIASPSSIAQAAEPPETEGRSLVKRVQFKGLVNVSDTFCRNKMVTAAGQPFSQTVLDEDIRRLVRTGKFLDVRAETSTEQDQTLITIHLQERPLIASIEFAGNEKFSDKALRKEIDLAPGEPLNTFRVRQAVLDIEHRYKDAGYADVQVQLDQELMRNENRLLFVVEEGPRVRLRQISFEGNAAFTDRELRSRINVTTYVPLFRTGDFNPDVAEHDAAELQNFYHDRGYLDARVSYRTETLEPVGDLGVVFVIDEGTRYSIAEIRFQDNTALSDEQLQSAIQLQPGEFMRQDFLLKDIEALKQEYGQRGYLFAVVAPTRVFTKIPGQIVLTFRFDEGTPYAVGRIQLRGNEQTLDKVIRRELQFFPEELFDTTKMKNSEKNIRGTGIFQSAKITPVGDQPGVRDVIVDVVEMEDTTRFILGGGVGSNSGIAGTVSFESRNFDLFDWPRSWGEFFRARAFRGAGQYFRVELSPGSQLSSFRIDFREPYLMDRPLRFGSSFYLFQRGRLDYDEQRLGTVLSLGRPIEDGLFKGWSSELAFRLEDVRIDDLELFPAKDILDAEGHNRILSFQGRLVRNRTDRRFSPTAGDILTLSYEQAVGDFTFGKLQAGYRWYQTLSVDEQDRATVLGLKTEAGYIFGNAPIFERFYAGGLGSLRGFEFRGVTPRDGPFFDDDQRIGGHFKLLAGAECSFPLFAETIRGVLFTDMGTVEEDFELTSWRASVGFGVRIFIENYFGPIPLEFNLAFPLAKDGQDDTQAFSFAIGITF